MIAFEIVNLSVSVKEQKGVEWIPSYNHFGWKMIVLSDPAEGIIENPLND
jgi:hypothetical protein